MLGARLDELFADLQSLRRKFPRADRDLEGTGCELAASGLYMDEQRISAGRFLEVDAKNRFAQVGNRNFGRAGDGAADLPERYTLGVPLGRDFRQWFAAAHFQKQQAALSRRRRAQFQSYARAAGLRDSILGQQRK